MKKADKQYHIVEVAKSDELNRAREVDLIAECNAIVEDVNPHGDECLNEDGHSQVSSRNRK